MTLIKNSPLLQLSFPHIDLAAKMLEGIQVSVTALDETRYLLCDYLQIWLYNTLENSLECLTPELTAPRYVPTGVHYCHANQRLYLANYTANNILVFRLDLEARKIIQTETIASPNIISPENVFVTDDGRYLACANYDGDNISFFDISGPTLQPLWSVPIPRAHGVTLLKNKIYATSLAECRVYELSFSTGETLRTMGQPGWNPEAGDFHWPTTVTPYDHGHLLVSDAHTGAVSLISIETFQPLRVFGQNGPSLLHLNMPYGVVRHGGEIVILSSFQHSIVHLDATTFDIQKRLIFSDQQWQYPLPSYTPKTRNNAYATSHEHDIELFQNRWQPAYNCLLDVVSQRSALMPPVGTLFSHCFNYFIESLANPETQGRLLFSPQSIFGIYLRGLYILPFVTLMDDYWEIDNRLYGPFQGEVSLSRIESIFRYEEAISTLENARHSNGWLAINDYLSVYQQVMERQEAWREFTLIPDAAISLLPSVVNQATVTQNFSDRALLYKTFLQSFGSPTAKIFLKTYLTFTETTPETEIQQAATEYYHNLPREQALSLDEFVLVGMLCRVPPFFSEPEPDPVLTSEIKDLPQEEPPLSFVPVSSPTIQRSKAPLWVRVFKELSRIKRRFLIKR